MNNIRELPTFHRYEKIRKSLGELMSCHHLLKTSEFLYCDHF